MKHPRCHTLLIGIFTTVIWMAYHCDNIGYAATEAPADRKPVTTKLGLSLHAGIAAPDGEHIKWYDPGINILTDATCRFDPHWSLVGLVGFNKFNSYRPFGDDLFVWNISLNLRHYRRLPFMPGNAWQVYFAAGPGVYIPNLEDNDFGYNLGFGINTVLSPSVAFECGGDYHQTSESIKFLHAHIGFIFWLN